MITREEYGWLNIYRSEGFRWIIRDKNKWLYVYDTKPEKRECEWRATKLNSSGVFNDEGYRLFQDIKWEDEEPTKIDDLIRDYESHQVIVDEKVKVEIPSFVAEWIEKIKPDNSLRVAFAYIAERKADNYDDPLALWIEEGNSETFARAWLDGYEVEEEKQYILKFSSGQYLYSCDLGMTDESLGCKLTQVEIESVDPRLMQFAVEVE